MLLDELNQSSGVGTDQVAGLLTVLEDEEGRHGTDAELLGQFGDFVDIELEEVNAVLEFVRVGVPVNRLVSHMYRQRRLGE